MESKDKIDYTPWKPGECVLDDKLSMNLLGLACIHAHKTNNMRAHIDALDLIEATVVANSYLNMLIKIHHQKDIQEDKE